MANVVNFFIDHNFALVCTLITHLLQFETELSSLDLQLILTICRIKLTKMAETRGVPPPARNLPPIGKVQGERAAQFAAQTNSFET